MNTNIDDAPSLTSQDRPAQPLTLLDIVAQAIGAELVDQELAGADLDEAESNHRMAVAALIAMRDHTLVYRDEGGIVHRLVGEPDDIWKTIINSALAHGSESDREHGAEEESTRRLASSSKAVQP